MSRVIHFPTAARRNLYIISNWQEQGRKLISLAILI